MTLVAEPSVRAGIRRDSSCPMCSSLDIHPVFTREFHQRTWHLTSCANCGLKFTYPKPTSEDIASFYSGSYHGELRSPGAAEKAHSGRFRQFAALIERYCPPPARVFDIGCSTGLLLATLNRRGYDAEGVEYNADSARWGAEHYGVKIYTDPVEAGGYPAATYDLVSMTDVLEHTLHPVEFLKHVKHLLKPRGHCLVTFPDIESPQTHYSLFLANLLGKPGMFICHIPQHTWEFSQLTAVACFDRAGFDVVALHRRQPLSRRWPWKAALLELPCWCLSIPPLAGWFGFRMQFVIRSRS